MQQAHTVLTARNGTIALQFSGQKLSGKLSEGPEDRAGLDFPSHNRSCSLSSTGHAPQLPSLSVIRGNEGNTLIVAESLEKSLTSILSRSKSESD